MTDITLDKDEKRFAQDLAACAGIAREIFPNGIDVPKAAIALYEILGSPRDLKPSEKEETIRNLAAAAAIAREAFSDPHLEKLGVVQASPTLDVTLDIYEMHFGEEDDEDEE